MKGILYIVVIIAVGVAGVWFYGQNNEKTETLPSTDVEDPLILDDLSSLRANIVGTWQSTDDVDETVTYNNNGSFRNLYGGSEMQNGEWEMYEEDGTDGGPSGIFIRTVNTLNSAEGDAIEYTVVEANGDTLALSLLGRGNTLRYIRVIEQPSDPGI